MEFSGAGIKLSRVECVVFERGACGLRFAGVVSVLSGVGSLTRLLPLDWFWALSTCICIHCSFMSIVGPLGPGN